MHLANPCLSVDLNPRPLMDQKTNDFINSIIVSEAIENLSKSEIPQGLEETMCGLPDELWVDIFSKLSYGKRRNIQAVSKRVRDLVRGTWTQKEIEFCNKHYEKAP